MLSSTHRRAEGSFSQEGVMQMLREIEPFNEDS